MAGRGREWQTLCICRSMAKHARTVVVTWVHDSAKINKQIGHITTQGAHMGHLTKWKI